MNTKSTLIHHTCMRIPLSKNKKLKKKLITKLTTSTNQIQRPKGSQNSTVELQCRPRYY